MSNHSNSYCEAWVSGSWKQIPVATALSNPKITVKRCLECKGPIKLHKQGRNHSTRPHAEHRRRFRGCSLGDCFDGKRRLNPEQVEEPETYEPIVLSIPEEVKNPEDYWEGATVKVSLNRHERDPKARKACLARYGYECSACSQALGDIYGKIAARIIHVHHLKPLAKIGKEYRIDPVKDLRPVCPNCHAVIHSRKPPYGINEVKGMLKEGNL